MDDNQVGVINHYFNKIGVAALTLSGDLAVGDSIKIAGEEKEVLQKVESMQIDRKPVESAKKGDDVAIKVNDHVREGWKVFKV